MAHPVLVWTYILLFLNPINTVVSEIKNLGGSTDFIVTTVIVYVED
jgi:hypothetical protein